MSGLLIRTEGAVRILVNSNPQARNAITPALYNALPAALDEAARDPAALTAAYARAHERLVDNPPWLFIVHDLNPRAMSRRVRGFRSAQSWFQDFTRVEMR